MNIQNTKQLMLDREQASRDKMQELREDHALQIAMRAEAKTRELDELLKALTPGERMRWRFEVAKLMWGRPDLMGDEKQLQHDDALMAMARYGITGRV